METEKKIDVAVNSALDLKAFNIKSYDLRKLSTYSEYALLISGSSDRQVKSISDKIKIEMKKFKISPLGIEGEKTSEWILMDFDDLIIHIFLEDQRFHYDLERLWEDLPHKSHTQEV
jgi:ribosome-associated protein